MNTKYKVMMVASVLVASSMLSVYAGEGERERGGRKGSSDEQKAAHRERMEQHRTEMRERFQGEWKRISELPVDEQAEAKAELKEKMQKVRAAHEAEMKERGGRKGPSDEQKVAHKDKMKQHRTDMRERFQAERTRISKLPADEQAEAEAELKAKMQRARAVKMQERNGKKGRKNVEGAKKSKGEENAKAQNGRKVKGKREYPSDKEIAIKKEQWVRKVKEIEAKIAQLPPEQQKEAKVKLEKKKQQMRRRDEQSKNNKTTQELVNKLIEEL